MEIAMKRLSLCLLAVTLGLAACSSHTAQYTSGSDYLSAYPQTVTTTATATSQGTATSLDEAVRQAAAVEPTLRFPAKIGVARIARGKLTALPATEAEAMLASLERSGRYGTFTPVDPLTARLARDSVGGPVYDDRGRSRGDGLGGVLSTARIGAARQHLDAVLIYEVGVRGDTRNTGLAFADLTIIGGAILPTRSLTAKAVANAVLIDVRNGYRYGSASAEKDVEKLFTSWGSDKRAEELRIEVAAQAIEELAPEVEAMFAELESAMTNAQLASR